jgi:serine/threonine-protein kinase HipA
MRSANVYINNNLAGTLTELDFGKSYRFSYLEGYSGEPVSLTLPVSQRIFEFSEFPSFFDGLLPEGYPTRGIAQNRQDRPQRPICATHGSW